MAVAFNAQSSLQARGPTITFSHTTSGSERALIVISHLRSDDSTEFPTAITYAGISLTKVIERINTGRGTSIQIWRLENPASGINNVVVSTPNNNAITRQVAISFTGADQINSIEVSASNIGTASLPSLNITTVNNDALVVDGHMNESSSSLNPDTGQTVITSIDEGTWSNGTSRKAVATPSTVTMSWSGDTDDWAQAAVAMKTSGAGTTTSTSTSTSTTTSTVLHLLHLPPLQPRLQHHHQ